MLMTVWNSTNPLKAQKLVMYCWNSLTKTHFCRLSLILLISKLMAPSCLVLITADDFVSMKKKKKKKTFINKSGMSTPGEWRLVIQQTNYHILYKIVPLCTRSLPSWMKVLVHVTNEDSFCVQLLGQLPHST